MKNLKKILLILVILFGIIFVNSFEVTFAWETVTQQDMRVWTDFTIGWEQKLDIWWWSGVSIKNNFIKTIMNYTLWIVFIVALSMFIYIWFELATAEWKQEKFTKWLKWLAYAWVGLAVIPLAYIIIRIATWFNF